MRRAKMSNRRSRRVRHSRRIICEALEIRQLMSLTVELRTAGGSSSATVNTVGQVVTLDLLAVISSSNNMPTQDGLQDLTGSIISTANGEHSVAGNLQATNTSPFKAMGAAPGTQQDLNGDGNLDLGSTDPFDTTSYFFARASSLQFSDTGTIVGNTLVFNIATVTYTVTSLNTGGQTSINFVPFVAGSPEAAGWVEDAAQFDNISGTYQAGSAFTLNDPMLVAAPTAVNDSFTVPGDTATSLNVLANDDVIDPLNPASVTVFTPPSHGTATPQSNGTILYTPTTGYFGPDSFVYTVADTDGHVSNTATVSLNVVSTPAPVAQNFPASTFANQTDDINVLAHVTSGVSLNPATVVVVGTPSHGTAKAQSDGTIQYSPSENYIGTDTFTYTVQDTNNETSNTGIITVTITAPIPPVANDDNFNISAGAATTLNVQANDTMGSVAIAGAVVIESQPTHGTVAVQSSGNVLYTPTAGYTGVDTFKYVDRDVIGDYSGLATVNLNITTVVDVPPVAGNVTAQVTNGQTGKIDVLDSDTSATSIAPGSVKVATIPSNGTATANSDGTISYTPVAGFVGADSFTYTVADAGGTVSSPGTVTVDIGANISNAKGSAHSLTFTDAANGIETISLNFGSAAIYFTGTGSLSVAKNGKGTVTGTALNLGNIVISGTKKNSTMTIKGSATTPVTLGGITNTASPMGGINAASANITGDINLSSVGSLTLGNITNSTITIGSNLPEKFALTAAAVSGSTLNSTVPITTLKATSWTGGNGIAAPAINNLTIKTNGLASNISSGTIGTITLGGDLSGNINASSIKSLRVSGNINGSAIAINSINSKPATLGSLTAESMTGTSVYLNVDGLVAPIAPINVGAGTIGSIRLTGKAGDQFTNSFLIAQKINSASLGNIMTDNSANQDGIRGDAFGIDATTVNSVTGIFAGHTLKLGPSLLKNETVLTDYLTQLGVSFGDFVIQV